MTERKMFSASFTASAVSSDDAGTVQGHDLVIEGAGQVQSIRAVAPYHLRNGRR